MATATFERLKRRKRPRKRRRPCEGWQVDRVLDLRESDPLYLEQAFCGRCGRELRYIHVLSHAEWSKLMFAGAVCAGHLVHGYDPHRAERKLLNLPRRRAKFLSTKNWKISARGNPYRKTKTYTATIFPNAEGPGRWKVCLHLSETAETIFSPGSYYTQQEAKEDAFGELATQLGWVE